MLERNFFHCILIFSFLYQIYLSKGSFTLNVFNQYTYYEIKDLIATDYLLRFVSKLYKRPHLLEVLTNLLKTFNLKYYSILIYIKFLIEFFEERNIGLKFFIVISYINERSKNLRWENQLKGFSVFLN